MTDFDIAIVGGGINGCAIARDAAGRGLRVLLCEQDDLGAATSSASTKLIHGGLRYLEHYKFRLVREALREREVLWAAAPHIVWPLRFVLPHHRGLRPGWLIRLGLFLYDHIGGREKLPPTRGIDLRRDPLGDALREDYRRAFEYSDCWVDDSRLVILNALDAAERGAAIRTRTRCTGAVRDGDAWRIALAGADGGESTCRARVLINAAGPWVADFLREGIGADAGAPVRLVKGSHIVVPRIAAHDRAYIFQNADRRVVFAIPFQHDFTLIGTTDRDYRGDPATVEISEPETRYLCEAVNAYLRRPVRPDDVVWSFAGVRPLYDDGASDAQQATRDYVLALDAPAGGPALLSVYGGKITTCRRLAEAALTRLDEALGPIGPDWTAAAALPGGDFPPDGFRELANRFAAGAPGLPAGLIARWVRAYGTRAAHLLDGIAEPRDLGESFGADLYAQEVRYLMAREWARTAQDVLWRRGKLGLRLSADQADALDRWMREQAPPEPVVLSSKATH